ncbi:MAG TPA: Hsp20/alpha crystallin family protein [Methylomirabilota bacterium]|nr:Hsp20/alpha crystallin family protein [Methylomirabilota bacterium]
MRSGSRPSRRPSARTRSAGSPNGSSVRSNVPQCSYGSFERSLVLPEGVDPAKVSARYSKGMLEISMPAPLAVAPKKVEIRVEGQQGAQKAIKAA